MTIIDTTTVSAFLVVLAVAVFATVVTFGFVVRQYVANRPVRPARVRPSVTYAPGRLAH